MKINILIVCLFFVKFIFADNSIFANNERQTKIYSDEILSAEAYYEAAWKGELADTEPNTEQLLFSSLTLIGKKAYGKVAGGIYRDASGDVWIVKEADGERVVDYNCQAEYVGARVMDLLVGPLSPEIKLFRDAPGYTAAKFLPGFMTKYDVLKDPNHKPIVGELELNLAMDLMGLDDRHDKNLGYIEMGDQLVAARVDFDHSFKFYESHEYIDVLKKYALDFREQQLAIERITSIPDDMILYTLGDVYNELWKAGVRLDEWKYEKDFEKYKNLGNRLIARKHALKALMSKLSEFETICERMKNSSLDSTKEDYDRLSQLAEEVYKYSHLHVAAEKGDIHLASVLIENGADIGLRKNGSTPLHLAAKSGHLDIVGLLLKKGANIQDGDDDEGDTPLHLAALNGHLNLADFLINEGADVNYKNYRFNTPLHRAAQNGHLNLVRLLLSRGADLYIENRDPFTPDMTPFHVAVQSGHFEVVNLFVSWLMDKGVELNIRNHYGVSVLDMAVRCNRFDIVALLVEKGVDVNDKASWDSYAALHYAALRNNLKIVRFLIERGADVNALNNDGMTALRYAFANGNLDMVKFLIESGADFNAQNELYDAASKGHLDVLQFLIESGVDINAWDKEGMRALHFAAWKGNVDRVKFLVENGADLNVTNNKGWTVLHYAVKYDKLDIVYFLVERGVDINAGDKEGMSALHSAAWKGNLDRVKFLVESGANINVTNNKGSTVLHYAAGQGNLDIVRFLVEQGANINARNKEGKTALYFAKYREHEDVIRFLKENGADVKSQRAEKTDF